MRLLVISDVHGNLAALEAVLAEPHDQLLCLGDIVGYGPRPADCLRLLRSHSATIVQGNHDRAIADGIPPACRKDFEWLAQEMAGLGKVQLSEGEITYLRNLPRSWRVKLAGLRFLFVHATPSDPLYRYLGPDPAAWREEVAGSAADVVVAGHTHLQFELNAGECRVVNPGSVGQPKDGDPRAAYAVIEGGGIALRRAEYDVERTVVEISNSGASAAAIDMLTGLLRTGKPRWANDEASANQSW